MTELRADIASLAESCRQKADSGHVAIYRGADLRWVADELDRILTRHAPTDPADLAPPPPSSERPTIQAPEPR